MEHSATIPSNEIPLVTALVVTFNHSRYIEAALDSVLAQSTRFPVEIIVSEDASTDGTRSIILGVRSAGIRTESARCSRIETSGPTRSSRAACGSPAGGTWRCWMAMIGGATPANCSGRPTFSRPHPACTAVFHNALVAVGDRLTDRRWTARDAARTWTLAGLMEGNPFATCAGMLRTDCVRSVPALVCRFLPDHRLAALRALRDARRSRVRGRGDCGLSPA